MSKLTVYFLALFMMFWIPTQSSDECRIDLVFILDKSGSICDSDSTGLSDDGLSCSYWQEIRDYMLNLTKAVPVGPEDVQLAVVTFALKAKVHWRLGGYTNISGLQDAISTLPYEGGRTNTYDGLNKTRGVFEDTRPNAEKVAVVITDGEPTVYVELTQPEAKYLRDEGVTMFAIGVGPDVPQNVLEYLSSNPRENETYFTVPNYSRLASIDFMDFLGDCERLESSKGSESEEDPDSSPTTPSGSGAHGSGDIGAASYIKSSGGILLFSLLICNIWIQMSRS